ncbi:1-acyl-sn-glycerol-3-phosphate acyltransferase [Cryobacterium mesophilum]|nr:lysophospholipid acyltransferase family protein [Terrimesophilobacter mesophilus]MBB5632554.1 1-acyl-sn-glycerol-3-phosphate acyltransferase [Terrimesophilobacter mesophilus]
MTAEGRGADKSSDRPRSEKIAIFRLLAALVLPPMNLLGRYRVIDGHYLPRTGPVVVAPNHFSEIDPFVIGVAIWKLGRAPRYLGKASLFKVPVLGWLLRKSEQIPVERAGTRGVDPLAMANQLVDRELVVVVYPEGTLTRDPDLWPMRGKTGAVRLALTADVPLIPVAHWGTQKIMPRYGKGVSLFPRKKVDIRFGPPVDLSAYRGRPLDSRMLAEATDLLMVAITALVAEMRGETPPAERWDPAQKGQAETGRFEDRR